MPDRYRCTACGNLTRFDVVATRRTQAFHHFSVGGDLEIEDEQVLEERVESVSCRWCGAAGTAIEVLGPVVAVEGPGGEVEEGVGTTEGVSPRAVG